MTFNLKNVVLEHFGKSVSLDCLNWEEVLYNSDNVSIFHLKSTSDYYTAYFNGVNLSFVLYENNVPIVAFPLFVYKNDDSWVVSSTGGESVAPPLFVRNITKKTRKNTSFKILTLIKILAQKLNVSTINTFEFNHQLSIWYLLCLDEANKSFINYQLAIQLTKKITDIKLDFRKSYKPLVSKALKKWDIAVCENNNKIFDEFRLLHFEVSGRKTRCMDTWRIQQQQMKNGEAFLVTVKDNGLLIGAGFFTYTKDVGEYSVGAYKRELFHSPIGHGVQMKAIEFLKKKGCKTYLIGKKPTSTDVSKPTSKELSIAHFKEGFSGCIYAYPYLEIPANVLI